jgi:hypothetical protein
LLGAVTGVISGVLMASKSVTSSDMYAYKCDIFTVDKKIMWFSNS